MGRDARVCAAANVVRVVDSRAGRHVAVPAPSLGGPADVVWIWLLALARDGSHGISVLYSGCSVASSVQDWVCAPGQGMWAHALRWMRYVDCHVNVEPS